MFTLEAYLETLFFQKSDNKNEYCWQRKQRDTTTCLLETANAWRNYAFNTIKNSVIYIYLVHRLKFINECITMEKY